MKFLVGCAKSEVHLWIQVGAVRLGCLRATPTVCHLPLAILIFAKKHKNSSPTVWQLALAILGSWQIPAEPAHICARPRRLASDVSREKVSSRTRRRHRSAPPDKHDAPPCLCRGRLPLRRASAQNRPVFTSP